MKCRLHHSLPCNLDVLLFTVLCITLFVNTHAKTRLREGPRGSQPERVLHGYTKTDSSPADRSAGGSGGGAPLIVDFAIHIMRDVVLWDELEKDGVMIQSCSFRPGTKYSRLKLSGSKLDLTDFNVGVIFAIEIGDFELNCMKPFRPVPGIDSSDNILFYKITQKIVLGPHAVILKLKLVPGKYVVPEVDFTVHEELPASSDGEDFAIYDDELLPNTADKAVLPLISNDTLPTAERFTPFKKSIFIARGATFFVNAGVRVRFFGFKIVRLTSLEFRWEQSLDAYLRASLNVKFPLQKNSFGEIRRVYIPRLNFRAAIPLVGKIQAGAFVALNYVVQLRARVKLQARINAKYKRHEVVTAKLTPARYTAVNKLSFGRGASSSGSVVVAASSSLSSVGFAGVRPVIGVGLTYTTTRITFEGFKLKTMQVSKSVDGNVGASVGAKLAVDYETRPFSRFFGKKLNAVCNSCHSVRANLRFVGKSLSAQLVVAEEVKAEKVIAASLFNLDIGTFCLVRKPCK